MSTASLGPFTLDYFKEEAGRFREVMCSKAHTEEQKTRAFSALFLVAVNVESDGQQAAQMIWKMIANEYALRRTFEIMRPLFRARMQ